MGTIVSKPGKSNPGSSPAADVRRAQKENEKYILVMQTVKCPFSQPAEDPDGDLSDDGDVDTSIKTMAIAFSWAHGGNEVYLCGSFNNWRRIPMTKSANNNFATIVHLPEGKHEYKYVVDEQWMHNPDEECMYNPLGTLNNVVNVAGTHIEKFDETLELSIKADGPRCSSPLLDDGKLSPVQITTESSSLNQYNMLNTSFEEPIVLSESAQLFASPIKGGIPKIDSPSCFREKYVLTVMYEQM